MEEGQEGEEQQHLKKLAWPIFEIKGTKNVTCMHPNLLDNNSILAGTQLGSIYQIQEINYNKF